jgi:hypothetical protein
MRIGVEPGSSPQNLALLTWMVLTLVIHGGLACTTDPINGGDDDSASGDDDADDDDADDDDASDDDGADDDAGDDDTEVESGPPSYGSGTTIDIHDMFDWINSQRVGYEPHDRYWGIPFSDDHFHQSVTWPITMTWDETAAAVAQNEADSIAAGGPPSLISVENGIIYVSTPCTAPYMVHTVEETMTSVNPFMRMAAYYHDFGGQGPVLDKLGVGASDNGDGTTSWVLAFD